MSRIAFCTLLCASLMTFSSTARAEEAQNPAQGFGMFRQCRENPSAPECVKKREERRERFAALRQKCQENPQDEMCLKFKERRQERRAKIEKLCQENPTAERCLRFKEHQEWRKNSPKNPA